MRVLYFFPHNPHPPRSGAHVRCLELLAGLRELGCEVTLASAGFTSETKWTRQSIDALRAELGCSASLYALKDTDHVFREKLAAEIRQSKVRAPVDSALFTPPGMRQWFAELRDQVAADIVMTSYAHWDGLVRHDGWPGTRRVVDCLDFISVNISMRRALRPHFRSLPVDPAQVADEVLSEDFFVKLGGKPHPREVAIFRSYDCAIAISDSDAELLTSPDPRPQVVTVPVTMAPCQVDNTYEGGAIFPTGPNPFNVQGYCYFARRVLPQLLEREQDFELLVTGYLNGGRVLEVRGVTLTGHLPDLRAAYARARFMVCPVFGGTGQQIKIVEAMAHGLPVVALRGAARNSPLRHGINGFVADDAAEFAEYAQRLWRDRALCKSMGEAARDTVATSFSRPRMLAGLRQALDLPATEPTSA